MVYNCKAMNTAELMHWHPLNQRGLTLFPAWMSNYIHYEIWDEIIYPFPNFGNG